MYGAEVGIGGGDAGGVGILRYAGYYTVWALGRSTCCLVGYQELLYHVPLVLALYLPLPSPFLPFCFFVKGCEKMSASWTGSASKTDVICPNVTDVLMLTAISQANVAQSALMLGNLWASSWRVS